MNIGTIVEAPLVKVRLAGKRGFGPVLGEIEEYFVSLLRPGDTFMFAGRLLRFLRLRDTAVEVIEGGGGDVARCFRRPPDAPDGTARRDSGKRMRTTVSKRLAEAGIEPSVGSIGDSYDNALAETIIGLFKTEVIHRRGPWRNAEAVELATLEWVDWFNHRRLFEPIGNSPPAEAEARSYVQTEGLAMAA